MRIALPALIVLGLALPATGAARLTSKAWATGKITRVSSAAIAVRGTVSLAFTTEAGGTSKSTLDGTRLLTCSVTRAGLVHGYRVGNEVSIVCSSGVLARIARGA